MESPLFGLLILIAGVILIVVSVLRKVFKVNEKFAQNEEIIRLLKKMAGEHDEY
jgi:F0F1-type ATP synthase assembly protein I